ncbi:hypothetical protein Tco_1408192 [Tanacetum coccineum]
MQTFRAESTGLRAEASKMLWADSVSTTYLIYRIPYVPKGVHIPEEEWRGKDTSLTHLKVFRDTKKSQVVLVDIPENLAENNSIVAEHGLSSEFTQSPGGSSDTSGGSENSGSFKDSRRSDEEYSEDGSSSKVGGFETSHVRRSSRESRAPVRYSPSANYLLLTKNELDMFLSQITSMKEGITKIVDVQASWAGRKPRVQIEGNFVRTDSSTEATVLEFDSFMQKDKMKDTCSEKQVLGYLLTVGVTTVEYSWTEEPCRDVHQVGDEREVEILRSFNWPASELITEDGVLP